MKALEGITSNTYLVNAVFADHRPRSVECAANIAISEGDTDVCYTQISHLRAQF